MVDKRIFALAAATVLGSGCVTPKGVGGIADDGNDDGGSSDSQGDDDGSPTGGDDAGPGDDGSMLECPDNPEACAGMCELGACGGPFARFDANGCPRVSCSDGECPAGRTCVSLEPWGTCDASSVGCFFEEGMCNCGGTLDCSSDVTICVPDDEAPLPADECVAQIADSSFSFTPELDFEGGVAATCTVLENNDPTFSLDCTGGFAGVYTLAVVSGATVGLIENESVFVEAWRQDTGDYVNEWVRITRMVEGDPTALVAVSADALLPPAFAAFDFWPTNVEVEVVELGCPDVNCGSDVPRRGQAIRTNGDAEFGTFGPGIGGDVPGKFGGWTVQIQVLDARSGSCFEEAQGPGAPAWYEFSFVRNE